MLTVKTFTVKFLPVLALSAVFLLADILVNRPQPDASASGLLPQIPQMASTVEIGAKADTILAMYQHFDVPVVVDMKPTEPEPTQLGLTQAQQEQQQGLLRELYIEDEIYRLSAIVNQGRYTASLSVTRVNQTDMPSKRLLLQTGDTLAHYKVVSVSARRITFTHGQRELWLQLFTPAQTTPVAN